MILYDTSIEHSILFYFNNVVVQINWGFPSGTVVKNLPANVGDTRDANWTARSGRPPGVGNGNPLQYSCLENSRGQKSLVSSSPWGHKELDTTEHTHPKI